VSHCSVVGQHHEVEARSIIVDIRRNDRPEVEEVGVDVFDFGEDALESCCVHLVDVKNELAREELFIL
jgi:phosphoribosylaminoimidazole-succinocarboxamide synthase